MNWYNVWMFLAISSGFVAFISGIVWAVSEFTAKSAQGTALITLIIFAVTGALAAGLS